MFGLLSSSQIYGLQQAHDQNNINSTTSNTTKSSSTTNNNNTTKHRRSTSSLSDSGKESKFFASLTSPTNFIEKFLRTELLHAGYDTIKNYKNFHQTSTNTTNQHNNATPHNSASTGGSSPASNPHSPESILTNFNCLHGSYRSNCESEFYESVNVNAQKRLATNQKIETDMTIKYSKNLLANSPDEQAPATLQNYQKLPECEQELPLAPSSGASSGDFNSSDNNTSGSTPLYKRLSFGGRAAKNLDGGSAVGTLTTGQTNEVVSDYSSSTSSSTANAKSSSTSLSSSSMSSGPSHHLPTYKSNNNNNTATTSSLSLAKSHDLQRTSSASSSGDCSTTRERKKSLLGAMSQPQRHASEPTSPSTTATPYQQQPQNANNSREGAAAERITPERAQRRKLIQLIAHSDQQNKLLQRELAKEKRRRSEELACVAKSLICFESKLKRDMKSVHQRLLEKDAEICRLVQQNRALRKRLTKVEEAAGDNARDEGVVEDGDGDGDGETALLMEDCLVLEALQCINCRKQFYDIELTEGGTTTGTKDGSRKNEDHTTEHGSSSDDTVSSSFYGARRSVRYTSKRTSGTFRDYMRSRAMNIDDPALLDQNSEENTSTISRDDSQASYEKMYARTIERMHGVKCESERESEQSGRESTRPASRLSSKSGNSLKSAAAQIDEDDGIFSPTQDDDFEEAELADEGRSIKVVLRRSTEFSEASPKQVYETSTDDWYASASDQEEMGGATLRNASNSYTQGGINPVLECVNQILLQQSMEESLHESANNSLEGSASSSSDNAASQQQQQVTTKSPNQLQVSASNLPRRSSLSGRRSSRSNSRSSDGQTSRNGTLTRKRVHFSTKNSMVHVPRNDEHEDDEEDAHGHDQMSSPEMISTLQQYHPMNFFPSTASNLQQASSNGRGGAPAGGILIEVSEQERLETLNYESIYSNEYEPIGSEHNSSNLYVDMESAVKQANSAGANAAALDPKMPKMPPALPPKPANLLKFKKSLQQLDEVPDEHLHQEGAISPGISASSEPDYCSISEVNVGITSVQIVADIHQAPASEAGGGNEEMEEAPVSELDVVEVSTVASDDTCAASQKTDEIEEIFADIPKLPNVAAIIAPKHSKKQQQKQKQQSQQSDYLIMSPKVEKLQQSRSAAVLNTSAAFLSTPPSGNKPTTKPQLTPLKLQLLTAASPPQQQQQQQQYKRKHMPNILAEINKRMSLPNSPTTPTLTPSKANNNKPLHSPSSLMQSSHDSTPLQAEFDWYNLDAEYGKAPLQQSELLKAAEALKNGSMLAEIHEDHENGVTGADEYNLDEEFQTDERESNEEVCQSDEKVVHVRQVPLIIEPLGGGNGTKLETAAALNAAICEAVNFPIFGESSPLVAAATAAGALPQPHHNAKAKKMKKNLANFEKFIEGSGLSTKPLPSKRKIYFAGPFV